jgi:hypothetical protein
MQNIEEIITVQVWKFILTGIITGNGNDVFKVMKTVLLK